MGARKAKVGCSVCRSKTFLPPCNLHAAGPLFYKAAKTWLAHYDEFVKLKGIGDEAGIAELRHAVAIAEGKEQLYND